MIEIRTFLEEWFPELVVADWDLSSPNQAEDAFNDPLFANSFDCRAIYEGSDFGDDESPYWVIIWDKPLVPRDKPLVPRDKPLVPRDKPLVPRDKMS